jgi:uncharacterized protein (TIGR02594 family)
MLHKIANKIKDAVTPKAIKPHWITVAEGEIGVKERAGDADNPRIVEYHATTSLHSTDDEVSWCSSFVNWVMAKCDMDRTHSAAARSWISCGYPCKDFKQYAIVIFKRGRSPWQGHVAFAMRDEGETILCLGGNQNDSVCLARYKKSDVLAYRWPRP